eukprot:XP_025012978.1 uncharacterized protein LOC8267391 isoform X3 [Ricinus communis]
MGLVKAFTVLSFLLRLAIASESEPNYIYHVCSNSTAFTRNSTYQNNLNRLLLSIRTNAINRPNGFYDTSEGEGEDRVYGLFFCTADLSTEVCQDCVISATRDIVGRCPIEKTAIVWYDECILRYSNQTIYSILALSPGLYMWNAQNVSDQEGFSELLATTMIKTANQAAAPLGAIKFATLVANFTASQKLYTLAQCTPDLSYSDSAQCLHTAISNLPLCCDGKRGGRILYPSCNIRYEFYPFYNETGFHREVSPFNNTTVVEGNPHSPILPPPPPPPIHPPAPMEKLGKVEKGGEGSKPTRTKVIASVTAAIVGILLFSSFFYITWRRKIQKEEEERASQEVQLLDLGRGRTRDEYSCENITGEMDAQDFPMIPFDIIEEATEHFSDDAKLGEGGFGPVYKGTLPDGKEIAVKRLSRTSGQGLPEFMNEVTLIFKLQHRNLVRLLGCCLEKSEKLLIYEYMPNKSLDVFLFDSHMGVRLDWQRRLSIISGIARGLLYLHEDSRLRIIHRDLKASNILLDYDMNPKISDFGMARIFGGNDSKSTNRIVGTYGYMSPEYAMEGLFSMKSDIFSFGVLLLEIISGRRNNRFYVEEEGESLLTFAWKLWNKDQGLELLDPAVVNSSVAIEVLKCVHIGLLCVQDDPAERPTMSSVVVMLASDTITLPQPRKPAFSIGQFVARSATSSSNPKVSSVNQNNLKNLLLSLPSNASGLKVFDSSIGNNTDKVYSQYMCLNYVTSDKCSSCIQTASEDIKQSCANSAEAIVWEEVCQLRYSNQSFLGHLDVSGNQFYDNEKNISNPDQFRSLVNQTVSGLIKKAAFNNSVNMYATGEAAFTSTEKLYALVQCTTDLSSDDCSTCLQVALANLSSCCYFSRGARLLSRSCYLRYELYAFYKGENGDPASAQNQGTGKSKQTKTWMIAFLTATTAILVVLALSSFIYSRSMKKGNKKWKNEIASQQFPFHLQSTSDPDNPAFQNQSFHGKDGLSAKESGFMDFASIHAATDNFCESNLLGQGGFGPVYKGILSDGKEIAVKRLATCSEQGIEEFKTEIQLIMKLQHKNLVRLLGFCFDGEEKLLVYEFMPNSSLDVILFDPRKRAQLDWCKRINIINGIAKGILYLHEDSRLRIIHRDLKPSNILLDNEMNPKISDFGTARIFGSEGEANTCRVVGTYGYMAPEYAMEGLYSTKSDVFSFGVLLLEIITGRKNTGSHKSKNAPNLSAYAWHLWNRGNELELMDPLLSDSCCPDEFSRYMHIGLLCLQEDACDRPTMSYVVLMLRSEAAALPQPGKPAFSVGRFTNNIEANYNDSSTNYLTTSDVSAR